MDGLLLINPYSPSGDARLDLYHPGAMASAYGTVALVHSEASDWCGRRPVSGLVTLPLRSTDG